MSKGVKGVRVARKKWANEGNFFSPCERQGMGVLLEMLTGRVE